MPRLPWVKFWVQDWLGAADIQRVSIATEGAWHRALCLMWHDGLASISMLDGEWGHLWRMDEVGACKIIDELNRSGICEVERTGHLVTLLCRRLQKQLNSNEKTRLRMQKRRGYAPVTQNVTPLVTDRGLEAQKLRGLEAKEAQPQAASTMPVEKGPERLGDILPRAIGGK